mmetsp:Transcript_28318/g.49817  ORF Transcript_28318/g.49817 Transcript_28318/m.49817 type:complete len:757 (-) Transcript_28318:127-2397(-)|eukprot:CAMPEP_0197528108 /NCGR_PEP_ID=MMETSP1318-20131121/23891_1 /TAXON_ID=552666 /ORGANISM="Partenskyella glossopodia, Strain RCC365" /LENGTH=756 /DNA_ID=CAMNT_0043083053 /DNA_START=52 /DNA_END=2322 /DNA_ORIENTATION=+
MAPILAIFSLLFLGASARWSEREHFSLSAGQIRKNATLEMPIAQNDGSIHVCIFSDRVDGLIGTLKSTALNAKEPEKVHVWIVTDNSTAIEVVLRRLYKEKIHIHSLDLNLINQDLIDRGIKPVWKWDTYNTSVLDDKANFDPAWVNENTGVPGKWDHSTMHMHPLNHLRFYIPYMTVFKKLDRIIFMDDDLIIQGDMQRAWDSKKNLKPGKLLVGACEVWNYNDEWTAFEYVGSKSTFNSTCVLGVCGRTEENAQCKDLADTKCVGSNFFANLRKRALEINGVPYDPNTQGEWNFGFTLFDLDQWRDLKLTDKYEKWMKANYEDHIFPETSLQYGLGIPFLSFYDHTSCWEDVSSHPTIHVRDGYGYISYPELNWNGLSTDILATGFVIHYDGFKKPWTLVGDPVFSLPFKRTMEGVKFNDYVKELRDPKTIKQVQKVDVETSFVIIAESHTGANRLMKILEQNKDICIAGGSEAPRVTFDADAFQPYSQNSGKFSEGPGRLNMQCKWAFNEHWVPKVIENKHNWCHGRFGHGAMRIKKHLDYLCSWTDKSPAKTENKTGIFKEFTRMLLDVENNWACRCPASTKVMGAVVFDDWIGHRPNSGDSKNFERPNQPSIWETLSSLEKKPKIIHLKRDIVDEILSKNLGSKYKKWIREETPEDDRHFHIDEMRVMGEASYRMEKRMEVEKQVFKMQNEALTVDYDDCMYDVGACVRKLESFIGAGKAVYDFSVTQEIPYKVEDTVENYDEIRLRAESQ